MPRAIDAPLTDAVGIVRALGLGGDDLAMRQIEQRLGDYAPPGSPVDLVWGTATIASWLADALAERTGMTRAEVMDAVYAAVLTRRGDANPGDRPA